MSLSKQQITNIHEIDIHELPDKKLVCKLLLEQIIKAPGDIIVINNKNYITVEKIHHYYFDGAKYQFTQMSLLVRPLENFY